MFEKKHLIASFFFGFLFILLLIFISGGSFIAGNLISGDEKELDENPVAKTVFENENFSISFPEDYQLNENKIVATEGFEIDQENTIQLISPNLPGAEGNMSIIINFEPIEIANEDQSTTCPELFERELDPINLGENIFTHSGLINCGPTQAAFFYVVNDGNVYEAKVETTADYEKDAFPEVIKILETLDFTN